MEGGGGGGGGHQDPLLHLLLFRFPGTPSIPPDPSYPTIDLLGLVNLQVLLFYPKDWTFVCPTEITEFSDRYPTALLSCVPPLLSQSSSGLWTSGTWDVRFLEN